MELELRSCVHMQLYAHCIVCYTAQLATENHSFTSDHHASQSFSSLKERAVATYVHVQFLYAHCITLCLHQWSMLFTEGKPLVYKRSQLVRLLISSQSHKRWLQVQLCVPSIMPSVGKRRMLSILPINDTVTVKRQISV